MSKGNGPQKMIQPVYHRVLLKISGEGLAGEGGFGIGADPLNHVAREVQSVTELGVQVGIVVGGGNILRGEAFAKKAQIPEVTSHYMGMLATVINALALQETLESAGVQTRVLSAIEVASVCEFYIRRRAMNHLEKGRVCIFAAGTGRPFVTTDTAAALCAVEIKADALLKATQVDGVYSEDPKTNPDAQFYDEVSYDQVINERLRFMDISAIDLCQRNHVMVRIFNLHEPGNMRRIVLGEPIGTTISK